MLPNAFENSERRQTREPEIKVWDAVVRIGHWVLALAFASLYLRYRKFPLHTYAGYVVLLIVSFRIVWGFVGSKAARFRNFLFGPREMISYAVQALRGHAPYYYSHNPMGAAMVYTLLFVLLLNVTIGLLLYSSGQQLGPLGAMVPNAWEDNLILAHKQLGHLTAIFVCFHLAGVIWAVWLHRENYVLAMLTGYRRIPRTHSHLLDGEVDGSQSSGPIRRSVIYAWLNYRRPVIGSILLAGVIIIMYLQVIEVLIVFNKDWVAY